MKDDPSPETAVTAVTDADLGLRSQAEKMAAEMPFEPIISGNVEELLHELRVHQIELQMQNEELRRTQHDLELSRSSYFDLYDLAPVGYLTLSPEGLIREANLAAATMLGVAKKNLLKRPFSHFILSPDQDIYYLHSKQCTDSKTPRSCEIRLVSGDSTVPFWVHLQSATSENGEYRLILTDIDDHKHNEILLHESEERFRSLVMAAQSGIVLQERGGKIITWNATAERVFGISASQAIGLDATEFKWNTYREDGTFFPGSEHPSMQTFATGIPCTGVIMKVIRDTGDFSWISINTGPLFRAGETTPYAVVITFSDITKRKTVEEQLRKTKEIFALFLKHSPIYAYIKEVTDGESRVLYASDNFQQMIGLTGVEMVGKTMAELFPQELAEKINADDMKIVSSGQVMKLEEICNDRIYETVKFPIVFEDQTLLAGFTIDIADRKQAEEALVVKSQQLEELNQTLEHRISESVHELRMKDELLIQQGRLAAMGEMINNIAHQWRQPLNNIGLIVQNLQLCFNSGTLTNAIMSKDVSNTMQLLQQMSGTINDFRNFFSQKKTLQTFVVNEAIQRSLNFMLPALKCSNIAISSEEQPDVTAEGFPGEYTQVVLNILTNAKDVLLERGVAKPSITIRIFSENNRSVVTISDNGGGIQDELLSKIFDPYFTTKHKSTGTGIGLFMSKMIIEKNMHGSLTARNIDGGAEFRIEL